MDINFKPVSWLQSVQDDQQSSGVQIAGLDFLKKLNDYAMINCAGKEEQSKYGLRGQEIDELRESKETEYQ